MARLIAVVLFLCLYGLAAGPLLQNGHQAGDSKSFRLQTHPLVQESAVDDISWSSLFSQLGNAIETDDEETVVLKEGNGDEGSVVSLLPREDNMSKYMGPTFPESVMDEVKTKQGYGFDLQQMAEASVDRNQVEQDFELDLLQSLGLPSRPRPSGKVEVPWFMEDLHSISNVHHDHCTLHQEIHGNIFRSIREKDIVPSEIEGKKVIKLRFSTSAITPNEIATHGEVKVRIELPRGAPRCDNFGALRVSLCGPEEGSGGRAGGCASTDITSTAGRYSADFKVQHTLIERVTTLDEVHFVVLLEKGLGDELDVCLSEVKVEAYLLLATYDSAACVTSSRKKRSMRGHHDQFRYPNICHLRPYLIDFRTIGWSDWVMAPLRYHANRCYGECPFPITEYLNGTNHAILQTLVNSYNDDVAPETCCVPVDYKSLSVLYIDHEENVVLRKYKDMVVTSCGCR